MRQNNKFSFAECQFRIFRKLEMIHSILSHFTYKSLMDKRYCARFCNSFWYKPDSYTCSSFGAPIGLL